MSDIVIVNGPFGSGKTVCANILRDTIISHTPKLKINRVTDGDHLVHQIKDVAHGIEGAGFSNFHYHPWMSEPTEKHNHSDLSINPHFPFTVIAQPVLDAMMVSFLDELWKKNQEPGLTLAELGTGIAGDLKIGRVDLSTGRFLEIAAQQTYWSELKNRIVVVAVDAAWDIRLERNPNRPEMADGINQSWLLQKEAMKITQYPDSSSWNKELNPSSIVKIDNNPYYEDRGDGLLEQLAAVERLLRPRWSLVEGNPARAKKEY